MDRVTELRVKDEYGNFSKNYPIGAKGENVYLNNGDSLETTFNKYLNIFYVLGDSETGQTLYSAYNTAYRMESQDEIVDNVLYFYDDETLYLISKYFNIIDNGTTLMINIKEDY